MTACSGSGLPGPDLTGSGAVAGPVGGFWGEVGGLLGWSTLIRRGGVGDIGHANLPVGGHRIAGWTDC